MYIKFYSCQWFDFLHFITGSVHKKWKEGEEERCHASAACGSGSVNYCRKFCKLLSFLSPFF